MFILFMNRSFLILHSFNTGGRGGSLLNLVNNNLIY